MLFVGLVVRTHRALLYLQMGDRPLALEAARSMIEECRDGPQELHHRLVYCHVLLECGEMDRAKEVLGTIDPQELTSPIDRVNYFQLLGNQLARLGDVEGLLAMTEAVEAECEDWGTTGDIQSLMQNNRAVADILRGDLDGAAKRLAELPVGKMGKMVRGVTLNNRAWIELRRGGDPVSALEWATEALKLIPGKSAVQGTYGAALLETGADPRRALRFLEKPVENLEMVPHQERAHVLFYAARALSMLGKQQRASTLMARMSGLPGADGLLQKLELLPA
jgi:predicted Zn-dependent protease